MGNHVADASPLQLSKRRPDFAHLNERVSSALLAHGTLTIPPCVNRRGGVPLVMDGPNNLRAADRYGDLVINPWSECQVLLATWRPLVPEAMPTVPASVVPLDELLWS